MNADELACVLGSLPKEDRYDAGERIRRRIKQGYTHIRLFDRLGVDAGEYSKHDLIGTRPPREGEKEPMVEFLFQQDGL